MANKLTISTIGARPPVTEASGHAGHVDAVIGFWREQIARVLPDKPDLIVLPELCELTDQPPFESHVSCAAQRDPALLDFFAGLCRKHDTWLAMPTLRATQRGVRNSVRLLDRRGLVAGVYDKNYPTIHEIDLGVEPGESADVIETEFGRVGCVICFDLNFEALRRRYAEQRPDLMLFCSMYHGGHVQVSWAYQCRAHFVSAVSGLSSGVLSPMGETLATSTNYTPYATCRVNLDCCVAHLDYNAEKLEALKREYGHDVDIHDPGLLAPVLITSRSPDATARQMAEHHGIELLDDYLRRAAVAREQATHHAADRLAAHASTPGPSS